ncbi:MAG: zinc-ribbon domain-containing protein [Bacilli bacterium]
MFCSKCGFQNNPGENFCRQCGAGLENNNQQFQQSNQFIQPQQNMNNNQQSVNINTQNINSSTYKLTLTRPKGFVGSLVKFNIFIDDNQVGTIKNGETIVLNVSSGNHTISFNKTMNQNINISGDTFADVVVIAGNKFGLSNIRDNNGLNVQNNELYTESADKIIKSAKGPLIFSCACIAITFIMLFTVQMVISPWLYGISIGYTIINLSSLKKHKQVLNDKYGSIITLNIVSIVVSIIGFIISGYLMIG